MEKNLTAVEIRILGCLIEKQKTTPEYYPLSLNALKNACNQKSNRYPVVDYDEKTVVRGLESLRNINFAMKVSEPGSRVVKYSHYIKERLKLTKEQLAVLCVLLLRGPQTPGELRGRTERIYEFKELPYLVDVLEQLIDRDPPLVQMLPRQTGRKENRYMHLLGGAPVIQEQELPEDPKVLEVRADDEKVESLEIKVTELEEKLEKLEKAFNAFRAQFE